MTWDSNTNKTWSITLKDWTTRDFRNASSTTNLEEEETVDARGNDGKASIPEQVKRPNPWRKMMLKTTHLISVFLKIWKILVILSKSEFYLNNMRWLCKADYSWQIYLSENLLLNTFISWFTSNLNNWST